MSIKPIECPLCGGDTDNGFCHSCHEADGHNWHDQDYHIDDPDHPDYHGPISGE